MLFIRISKHLSQCFVDIIGYTRFNAPTKINQSQIDISVTTIFATENSAFYKKETFYGLHEKKQSFFYFVLLIVSSL